MNNKRKYKYLRNLNLTLSGVSLGTSYYLKRKKHSFLAIIPAMIAGNFFINAYDNNVKKKYLEEEEERINNLKRL